jgi:hypothetical protein
MADRHSNELVVEWHPVDAEKMDTGEACDDGGSAVRRPHPGVGSAEDRAA